jgi:cell division protein FtsL
MQDGKITIQEDDDFPKDKDVNNAKDFKGHLQKNGYFGKFILLIGITSSMVILFTSLINKARQERFQMVEIKKALDVKTHHLETNNSRLEKEYSALRNNPVRIEKEAREKLGFINPAEISYPRYNFHVKSMREKEPVKEVSQNSWKEFFFEGPIRWQFPVLIILVTTALYLISYHYEYRKLHKSNQ